MENFGKSISTGKKEASKSLSKSVDKEMKSLSKEVKSATEDAKKKENENRAVLRVICLRNKMPQRV